MVPRMQTSDDVLVVGAGPVGMLTALLLHSLGSRVQILERRPARWNLPRAVTCYSQILRILQALGILEECLAAQAIHPFRPELADKAEWMGADGQLVVQIPFNGELSRSGMDVVYGSRLSSPPDFTYHKRGGWRSLIVRLRPHKQ